MITASSIADLHAALKPWRQAGEKIAFVPTMGNLHAGHLQLVKEANANAEKVVVSIFVNPSQFGAGEDFANYPRTEAEDQTQLETLGTDLLFMPSVSEMYPHQAQTAVRVAGLSELYCGASRPGHFDGVATIVCKLFNIVQPDIAIFGRKDFQQLAIIQAMVRDLNMPIEIIGVDTVREASGLAMSSRNGYLTASEKTLAANLYLSLLEAKDAILCSDKPFSEIEQEAQEFLATKGFTPDYFSICRNQDLKAAGLEDKHLVILAAATLGKTRLIDNVCVSKQELNSSSTAV
jgi:pantoate--beta-alanine ligase